MFEYEELIALALGIFVVLFILIRMEDLRRLPGLVWLAGSFGAMFCASVATVAEGWMSLGGLTNVFEHLCYACGVGLMAWWIWRHMPREGAGV